MIRGHGWRLDAIGIALAAMTVVWVGLVAGGGGAPAALLVLASVAAVVIVRRLPTRVLPAITGLIAAAPFLVAIADSRALTGAGPLGYANASGALYVIAAGAALMLGRSARPAGLDALRYPAYGLAVIWILIPWRSEAIAAALLATLLPLALVPIPRRVRRTAVPIAAGLVVAGFLTTAALGLVYEPGAEASTLGRAADSTPLTERRLALWSDALDLMGAEPLRGVGPGRFRETSPTALGDRDAVWAHNEYLELGAETGVPGLVLMLTLVMWGFARMWPAVADPRAMPAVLTLAASGLHASVDYIWHFPAVPIALAALVGAASATGLDWRRGRSQVDAP